MFSLRSLNIVLWRRSPDCRPAQPPASSRARRALSGATGLAGAGQVSGAIRPLRSPRRRSISSGVDHHRINPNRILRALQAPARASSDYDLNPDWTPAARRALRPASVLVPLVQRGAGLDLILTRRPMWLKHHPGHVAFPGGKQEPSDPTPLAAALREAEEEIGLAPADVEVLGYFDTHETVTDFRVTPFVGLVSPDFRAVPDRSEVDEVFEVPLAFVLDPDNMQVHARRWKGRRRAYYAVPYGPHYIWGATARILKALSDRMQGA